MGRVELLLRVCRRASEELSLLGSGIVGAQALSGLRGGAGMVSVISVASQAASVLFVVLFVVGLLVRAGRGLGERLTRLKPRADRDRVHGRGPAEDVPSLGRRRARDQDPPLPWT